MEQSTVTLAIGPSFSVTYRLGVTNAPTDYDNFGTLTVADMRPSNRKDDRERVRYVLIESRHEEYHAARYSSGLYSYEKSDALPEQDLAERLYRALKAGMDLNISPRETGGTGDNK